MAGPVQMIEVLYSRIETVAGVILLFWPVYFSWAWKWPWMQSYFIKKPVVEGTWVGYLISTYDKRTRLEPIAIVLSIHQNFFETRITSFTQNFVGISTGERMIFDATNNQVELLYQYSQKIAMPVNEVDGRRGSAQMRYFSDYLAGNFWTAGKTVGFMRVHKMSGACYLSFEKAFDEYKDKIVVQDCFTMLKGKTPDLNI